MLCVGGRCPIYVHTAHLSLQVVVAARIMACNVGGREVLLCNVRMRGCWWMGIISKLLTHPEVYVSKNYESTIQNTRTHPDPRYVPPEPHVFPWICENEAPGDTTGIELIKMLPTTAVPCHSKQPWTTEKEKKSIQPSGYGQQQCITNFLLIGSSLTKIILRITQCVLQRSSSTGRSAL